MRISPRVLILSAIVITVVSGLFCIIGLATKGWAFDVPGLFCDGCYKPSAALSIISFILLVVSVIALVLLTLDIFKGVLRYIPIIVLFIASFFLLATFASFGRRGAGYSYDLMVVAHFFSYVALAVSAYWFGQFDATSS